MDRKQFLKNSAIGIIGASASKVGLKSTPKSTYDIMSKDIGFNHLPAEKDTIIENNNMKRVIHKSNTRGHADHGWLNSHHTFSFASYRNPDRMNFGVLRVLNDDVVAGGKGFGKHPHDNMEIISIPLQGDLEHQDSMGNTTVIKQGDIQVMSAGTGVQHSEYNKNVDQAVKFLQIWLFPNKRNVSPRYDQLSISEAPLNQLNQVLSPNQDDEGVWIHQDAWFHIGEFNKDMELAYSLKRKGNGVYAFMLNGGSEIEGDVLDVRDGMGLWETDKINIKAQKGSKMLIMEVPMNM